MSVDVDDVNELFLRHESRGVTVGLVVGPADNERNETWRDETRQHFGSEKRRKERETRKSEPLARTEATNFSS
jgi:hypothetical protein